jgi:hypothetical protein
MKTLITLFFTLLFLAALASCSKRVTCPTYSKKSVESDRRM